MIKNQCRYTRRYLYITRRIFKDFDFIWASPDCTTYSLASHGLHRIKGGIPVSDYAKQCDINNEKFVNMLIKLGIPFIIENPRGHLRNMSFMKNLHRVTVYYSTYGAEYSKPTDLFSNYVLCLNEFDTTISKGTKHLDYCKGYNDFLGRCKIPNRLINDIVKTIRKWGDK